MGETEKDALGSEMLEVRAAARLVGRNPETVRRWVWSGRLTARRRGNRLLVARRDVEALAGGGEGRVSLAAWADRAGKTREALRATRRGSSAADLVIADRARRGEAADARAGN